MAVAIVIALRVVVPFSILRWPIGGALASMLVDALDVVLVDALARVFGEPLEFGAFYSQIDKWLDTWYLGLEAFVAWRWPESMLRRVAIALFAWRLLGVILFEATASRELLLVFPNLFENFYLFVVIARRFAPQLLPRTWGRLGLVLVLLWIPKIVQEWVLHWEQLHPWQWLRETLLRGAWPGWLGCRLSTRPAVPSPRGPVSCGHGPSPPRPDPWPRRVGQRRRDGPARRRPAGARDRRAGGRPAARSGGAGDPRLRGPPGGRRGSRGGAGDPPAGRRRRAILRRARGEPRRGGRVRRGATAARAGPPLVPAPPARPARRLGRPHGSVGLLQEQAATRVPDLVPIRYGRMAVSPFTFFRGAALPMAADLATTPASGVIVQLCGDAHLSNFGLFASPSATSCSTSTTSTRRSTARSSGT